MFDNFATSEPVVSGVTIRRTNSADPAGESDLIDMHPQALTSSAKWIRDEPLALGSTFTDPQAKISVTLSALGSSGATVVVDHDAGSSTQTTSTSGTAAPASSSPPPSSPPAPDGADGDGGTSTPPPSTAGDADDASPPPSAKPRRVTPSSVRVGRRMSRASLLSASDRRHVNVPAQQPLLLAFRAAGTIDRTAGLTVRLSARRRCAVGVAIRSERGGWRRVRSLRAARRMTSHRVALKIPASARRVDVRVTCRRSALTVDTVALKASSR